MCGRSLSKVKEDQKAGLRKASPTNLPMEQTKPVLAYQPRAGEKFARQAFTMLCADETPMVRRAAAHKMRDFVSVCAKQATATRGGSSCAVLHT